MRVALVHNFHSDATPSGENVVVDAETAALRRAGHDVRLAGVRNDEMAARPLHTLQAAATVATGYGIAPLPGRAEFVPDVVHVHNLFPFLGERWLGRLDVPLVTTLHSYRQLCANGYLLRDGKVCTLCPDGRPWSAVRHGCYRDSRLGSVPLAIATRRGAAAPLLRHAAAVLVLSDRAHEVYRASGVPEERLVRDWNFVPDELAAQPGAEHDDTWLYVGRLSAEKGIDRLLGEWPAERQLVVLGEGPLRRRLEAAAGGKRVTFRGSVGRPQVLDAMRRAAGLVMPSVWYEMAPMGYVEALAVGLPVLAYPPNAVADAVTREGTGIVGEWGRLPAALAEADERFEDLRGRCRAVFEQRYSESAWLRRRIRLYERLTRTPVGATP